jgi:hypothetical protein
MTVIVHIEHPVRDYDTWKAAFDSDPIGRKRMGVRSYRICRLEDDPLQVTIDLEFVDLGSARTFRTALDRMWASPSAQAALGGAPSARIEEVTESVLVEQGSQH